MRILLPIYLIALRKFTMPVNLNNKGLLITSIGSNMKVPIESINVILVVTGSGPSKILMVFR